LIATGSDSDVFDCVAIPALLMTNFSWNSIAPIRVEPILIQSLENSHSHRERAAEEMIHFLSWLKTHLNSGCHDVNNPPRIVLDDEMAVDDVNLPQIRKMALLNSLMISV
jgi:hypothetical protein